MSNRIYHQQPIEDDDRHSISSSASLTLTESVPLLPGKHLDHTTLQQEFHWIFYNSLPIIGTYLLQSSFQFASIFTLGHLIKLLSVYIYKELISYWLYCLFLRYLLPGAPAYIAFEATKRYLQAQGIMHASTYSMMVTAPLNFVLNYAFVYTFGMGFIGAPLATSFSYWIMFLLLIAYAKFVKGSEGWGGWSRECLKDWVPFLKLAFSGIIIICAEWTAFEVSSLAASYLGTTDLAAQSILLTLSSATYTIPMGISIAATNRVGNAIGGNYGYKAKVASTTALLFSVLFGIINSLFFLLTRSKLGLLFSSDQKVIDMVSNVLPIFAIFQVTDGIASVGGGVIRGLGRQNVAAWINLVAYYLIALPFGFYLTFKLNWALTGLWTGLTIALFLVAFGEVVFLLNIDWFQEVKRAQLRVKVEKDKVTENLV
ncbi:hypothetical protein INT48_004443 [Thamnidium elegans]|uniref:MATE efflux family protein n=1 Tax=Thamnidium elegans TaxID=101142 RepID=A0A8H7VRG0_9FUNG|nr:hypothetical protein INT48_004443 [Thamnidium elegans]